MQLIHRQNPDPVLRKLRDQFFVPAFILISNKHVHCRRNLFELFARSVTVRADVLRAMLDLLQETGDPDFNKFVQIIGGDGKKLDAFKQRVAVIAGFFKNALVEGHPLEMAVEIEARILETCLRHVRPCAG